MQTNVANLSERDIRDIADYLSMQKLPPASYQLDPVKVAAGKARAEESKCGTGQRSAPAMALNEEEMDSLAQFLASLP